MNEDTVSLEVGGKPRGRLQPSATGEGVDSFQIIRN